ncbi:MAG: hypothetical protein H0T73_02600 [Ardenticatenales bacterium]|nr:hypothetical protein [Ardenticatenales bacterium]
MTVRRLFTIIFAISLFAMPITEALDNDMWWHLRTGEAILRDGIPRQDIFSFTVPHHQWITHEWLSEVVMWGVYQVAGFPGLILAFAAMIAFAFWLVYLRCVGRPYLAAFLVVLAGMAAAVVWGVRPQMFNVFFLSLYIHIIEGFKAQRAALLAAGEPPTAASNAFPRRFLLLPLLSVLWVNFHSGYLLGVVLLGTYMVGEALQLYAGQRDERGVDWWGVRQLAIATGLTFLASLLNPNGYELWIYPFLTLGSDVMQTRIVEWWSPNFHDIYIWPFALLGAVGVASLALSRKRPSWTDLLLFMGTGAAGLISVRHIPIFAVTASPIIARHLLSALAGSRVYPLLSGEQPEEPPNPRMMPINLLLIGLMGLFVMVHFTSVLQKMPESLAKRYPVAAVDFLEQEGLAEKRIYNSYNWGGYLIWRGVPVFVDGRADVYGDAFLTLYFKGFGGETDWYKPLDDYDADYVLMEPSRGLVTFLSLSEEWREIYRDKVAVIFERVK